MTDEILKELEGYAFKRQQDGALIQASLETDLNPDEA